MLRSTAELFAAAADPAREAEVAAAGLEVVARPGMPAPVQAGRGAFLVRRALGESRLAVLSAVERVVAGRGALESEGVLCEGTADGVFAEVGPEPGGRRSALQVAGPGGRVREDTVVLRPRRAVRARSSARPVEAASSVAETVPAAASASETEPAREAEAITDPVPPPRPPLVLRGTVGRGGANQPGDVQAVQDRLVELRALDAADGAAERPSGAAAVPEASLAKTIEAIERFEREQGVVPNGRVETRGATRTELDRALPRPTPAELAAVAAARAAVRETVSRGLTLGGPVGATGAGNAAADVQAVQRRLVELGRLAASHTETPPLGGTVVPQASLHATVAALRDFQSSVRFWVRRGTVGGPLTPGVVAPGDATAALLARVTVHTVRVGPDEVVLRDHVTSRATRSETGVAYGGVASPDALTVADYQGQGLSAGQAAALKLVSTFEGRFDAVNTYDRAQVSLGFVQFAGGRGLPPYLALLKARRPAFFRERLQALGVDVEYTAAPSGVAATRVVVLDPVAGGVLRAAAAEAAVRDDKKLTAALLLTGRAREVQLVQIEAAIRGFVQPALRAPVSWAPRRGAFAPLGALLRSQKGMAVLFDRAIQEGVAGARARFERVLRRVVIAAEAASAPSDPQPVRRQDELPSVQRREGDLLAAIERDLQAAADVAAQLSGAQAALEVLGAAARAAGSTVPAVLGRPEMQTARRALGLARTALADVVNVSVADVARVPSAIAALTAALSAESARLAFAPAPEAATDLAAALSASRDALEAAAAPVATAPAFLARVQRIRRSTLDAGLDVP